MGLNWFRQLRQEWTIPEIIPERCVHSQCEVAECTRCVDICPKDAWNLNDEALSINTGRCDGCGLCTAICPEAALKQDIQATEGILEGKRTLLLACEQAKGIKGNGNIIPCLHAASYAWLLSYHRRGCHELLSLRGDCENCHRYPGQELFLTRLTTLNTLLANRSAPVFNHQPLSFRTWEACQRRIRPATDDTLLNRRQFLRKAIALGAETVETISNPTPEASTIHSWSGQLPKTNDSTQTLYPFVPVFDTKACNGCDACVQLCPHQALQLDKNETGQALAYVIHADRCTGCNICVDACDQHAIQIHLTSYQQQPTVALIDTTCKACGSRFHTPVNGSGDTQPLCRICTQTNHHRNLFQVY